MRRFKTGKSGEEGLVDAEIAQIAGNAECSHILTFDQAAATAARMTLLS